MSFDLRLWRRQAAQRLDRVAGGLEPPDPLSRCLQRKRTLGVLGGVR
jgi:hypothetical protein